MKSTTTEYRNCSIFVYLKFNYLKFFSYWQNLFTSLSSSCKKFLRINWCLRYTEQLTVVILLILPSGKRAKAIKKIMGEAMCTVKVFIVLMMTISTTNDNMTEESASIYLLTVLALHDQFTSDSFQELGNLTLCSCGYAVSLLLFWELIDEKHYLNQLVYPMHE